jgi:hypothetical protein
MFRRSLLAVLLVMMPFAALAQSQAPCKFPAKPRIDWVGEDSGCRPGGVACNVGEVIDFSVQPVLGSFQNCDRFSWNFDDGQQSSFRNTEHVYTTARTFRVTCSVFNTVGAESDFRNIVLQICNKPAKPKIDWVGTVTGCRPGGVPCALGEAINFSVQPVQGGSFQACDEFDWSFGDGSTSQTRNPQKVYVVSPKGPVTCLVSNQNGGDGDSKGITVQTVLPRVETFKAESARVLKGLPVVISWKTQNILKIRIDPGNYEDSRPSGTVSFTPQQKTTYRLTAYGIASLASSEPMTVDVVLPRRRSSKH